MSLSALNTAAVLVFVFAVFWCGCTGRSAGTADRRDGSVEAGVFPADAAPPDGGPCALEELWTPDYRGIVSADPNDFDTPREGQSFRVRVTTEPLSPCQVPGPVFFESSVQEGRIDVALRAVVWTLHTAGQCPPAAEDPSWIVTIPGDSIRGVFLCMYAMGNPNALLELPVEPCLPQADCFCAQPVPDPAGHLEPCTYDCQCAEGSCLPSFGWDPGARGCMRPCNDIEACREGEVCTSYLDGPSMLCEPSPGAGCMDDRDCPFGYRCATQNQNAYCMLSVVEPDSWTCCVDTDCGYGFFCMGFDPNQGVCTIPCSTHEKCRTIHPEMICHRTGHCLVPLDG